MAQKRQVTVARIAGRSLGAASFPSQAQDHPYPDTSGQRQGPTAPQMEASPPIEGVYIISVAARILEMHPQTLRKYERIGLVNPSRTLGMLRLYSEHDIARLRLIKHLVDDVGMNLAGVEFVLQMFNRLLEARNLLAAIQAEEDFTDDLRLDLQRLLILLDVDRRSR